MQRRKHRLLIFFPFLHPSVYPSRLSPTLPLGPFTLPVRCVVLIRTCSHRAAATKAKKAKHPRGLSCHWWMKGMRKRMEREYVCLCVSLRAHAHVCVCVFWFVCLIGLYCGKSWTDGSTLPEGATEQKPGSHEFKIFTITSVTSWPLRKTWSLNHLQKCK